MNERFAQAVRNEFQEVSIFIFNAQFIGQCLIDLHPHVSTLERTAPTATEEGRCR